MTQINTITYDLTRFNVDIKVENNTFILTASLKEDTTLDLKPLEIKFAENLKNIDVNDLLPVQDKETVENQQVENQNLSESQQVETDYPDEAEHEEAENRYDDDNINSMIEVIIDKVRNSNSANENLNNENLNRVRIYLRQLFYREARTEFFEDFDDQFFIPYYRNTNYGINKSGVCKNIFRNKVMKYDEARDYKRIEMKVLGIRKRPRVHVMVAETFIRERNPINFETLNDDIMIFNNHMMEVNHKDFNKANNHVNNLEWLTHRENIQHYFNNTNN